MFNNFKKDPLAESVSKIMSDNDVRRQVESQLNEELGIFNKRALPHEYVAEYETVLEGRIKDALEGATRRAKAKFVGTKMGTGNASLKSDGSDYMDRVKSKPFTDGSDGTSKGSGKSMKESHKDTIIKGIKAKLNWDGTGSGTGGTMHGQDMKIEKPTPKPASGPIPKAPLKEQQYGVSLDPIQEDNLMELSKRTLGRYIGKATDDVNTRARKWVVGGTREEKRAQYKKLNDKNDSRMHYANVALNKMKEKDLKEEGLNPIQEEIRRNIILQMDYLSTMPTDDKLLAYVNGLTEDQKELIDDLLEEETFEEETLEEKSKWDESTRLGAKPQTVVAKNPMMMPRPVSTPTSAQTTPRDAGKPITPPVLADTAKEMTKSNPAADMASMFRNGGVKAAGAKTLKPGSKSTAKSLKESAPKMSLENMLRLHKPEDIPHTSVLKESFEHFLRTKLPEE